MLHVCSCQTSNSALPLGRITGKVGQISLTIRLLYLEVGHPSVPAGSFPEAQPFFGRRRTP
jgi:hypothetical protein